jgi:hypothetical protein
MRRLEMERATGDWQVAADFRNAVRWSGARIAFFGTAAVYVAIFWLAYLHAVVPTFEYYGFGYDASWSGGDILFVVALALLPATWLPVAVTRPSHLFLLAQYIVVYVPTLFVAYHSVLPRISEDQRVALCLMIFVGMTILQGTLRFWPLLRIPRIPVPTSLYYGVLTVVLLLGSLYLVQILGSNFRLVALTDIADVRGEASDLVESTGSQLGNYVFLWMNGVVLPLLFAAGLQRKRLVVLALVSAGYVLLYGIWASKVSLVAPMYLLGLYVLLKRPANLVPTIFVVVCAIFVAVPLFVPGDGPLPTLFKAVWVALVNVRVFALPGLLNVQYFQFFSEHPLTLGSHITGINALIQYPYDYDIPRTIGYHFYGDLMTANVNYWSQDGIAGFGLLGIPVISLLAAIVFWLLDSIVRTLPLRFVLVALGPVLLTISNTSLFTSLVTGGLLIFMVAFVLTPREADSRVSTKHNS